MDSKDSNAQESALAERKIRSSWLKVGAVAAASALAGGLAAAWFYRKTLTEMRSADAEDGNSNFRTPETPEDEI